jgi:NitT/TauT family transport system ATP-binding protein
MHTVLTQSPAKQAISVRGLSMSFDGADRGVLPVLNDISFDVRQGEFVCVIGPSGCGKSTLLNILAGFLRPTAGEVRVDGERVEGPRRRSMCIFQDCGIFPWLTVEQNVGFGLQNRAPDERRAIVDRHIRLVGLSGFENAYPRQLSGGMRQRAELARALAADPATIYMDEPFGALDYLTRMKLRHDLTKICEREHKTIVLVTHDIDEAVQLGDRVLVMSNRPATIQADIDVKQTRPRDPDGSECIALRSRLRHLLQVDAESTQV